MIWIHHFIIKSLIIIIVDISGWLLVGVTDTKIVLWN